MSEALYRRWFSEVWNEGRDATIDELFAANAVSHGLSGSFVGPAGFRAFRSALLSAFPRVRIEIADVVAGAPARDGSVTVAGRFTAHLETPKGAKGDLSCMSFARCRGGKIVEAWDVSDFRALERQLGALPF